MLFISISSDTIVKDVSSGTLQAEEAYCGEVSGMPPPSLEVLNINCLPPLGYNRAVSCYISMPDAAVIYVEDCKFFGIDMRYDGQG